MVEISDAQLWRFLDGELSEAEATRIERDAAADPALATRLDGLRVIGSGVLAGAPRPPSGFAAKVAASQDIRIYTIAIGDPASVGEEALDIETLQRVSELTGGQYFQAFDQGELAEAYLAIGELEPELYETISFRPRQSLHWVPVALAMSLYLVYHSVAAWLTRRRLRSARAA